MVIKASNDIGISTRATDIAHGYIIVLEAKEENHVVWLVRSATLQWLSQLPVVAIINAIKTLQVNSYTPFRPPCLRKGLWES